MSTIPKPDFPSPRPRRSSIGQAAAVNQAPPAEIEPDRPTPAPEGAARITQVVRATEAGAAPEQEVPSTAPALETAATGRGRRAPQKQSAATVASTKASKRPVASKDILLSLPEDAKERMVNTIAWTLPHTGIGQQSKFIRRAITELCDRLERDFNNGRPFPTPVIPADE